MTLAHPVDEHEHGQYIHFKSKEDPHHDFLIPPPSLERINHGSEFTSVSFDTPTLYTFSTSSSPSYAESPELPPSPDSESSLPELYSRKPATRLRSGNRVPRPRNAFMIFRSEFWAGEKISSSVERDHRHISRIIGHCWNQLSEAEKDVWRRKAEREKVEHNLRYPGYRFSPTVRTKKAVKRKVKRNGKEDLLRCQQVAALILAGKEGEELDTAIQSLSILEPKREPNVCKDKQVDQSSTLAPLSNVMELQPRLHRWSIPSNMEAPAFQTTPAGPSNSSSTCADNIEPVSPSKYSHRTLIKSHHRLFSPPIPRANIIPIRDRGTLQKTDMCNILTGIFLAKLILRCTGGSITLSMGIISTLHHHRFPLVM